MVVTHGCHKGDSWALEAGDGQVPQEHSSPATSCLCRLYLWPGLGSSFGLTGKLMSRMAEFMEMCGQGPHHPADLPVLLLAWEQEAPLETGCQVI